MFIYVSVWQPWAHIYLQERTCCKRCGWQTALWCCAFGAIMALKPRPQSLCGFLSNNWAWYKHWSQLRRTLSLGTLSPGIHHQPGLESLRVVQSSDRLFLLHSFYPCITSFTAVRPALSLGSPLLASCSFFLLSFTNVYPKDFLYGNLILA